MKKFTLPLIIFAVVVVFLAVGLNLDPRKVPSPLIGKTAPDFTLPRLLQAGVVFSPKDMLGKVWLLNIWGTWCVSCRTEHPVLNALAQQNLAPIVGLNYKDDDKKAKIWLRELGDPYELTAVDADGRISIDWGFYGAPETFVIDKQGIIRYKHIGPISTEDLSTTVVPLLKQLQQEAA